MLIPHAKDDNRKAELARRKKQPFTFGCTPGKDRMPSDWTSTGLVTSTGKEVDPRVNMKDDRKSTRSSKGVS